MKIILLKFEKVKKSGVKIELLGKNIKAFHPINITINDNLHII